MMSEIRNAIIESTSLGYEDHGILTCMLMTKSDGIGQGFGGYAFDTYDKTQERRVGSAYGIEFIAAVLNTLEVDCWEKLKGTHLRVDADHSKIHRIGHIIKDKWFDPSELCDD
jgi:hypothetical protein